MAINLTRPYQTITTDNGATYYFQDGNFYDSGFAVQRVKSPSASLVSSQWGQNNRAALGQIVSLGLAPGVTRIVAYGSNPSVSANAVPVTIWPTGGLYVYPTAAISMEVLSSSASDVTGGAGIKTIKVEGLNAAYAPISETVTLNGTSAVALVNQYFRLNRAYTVSPGVLGTTQVSNVGTITVRGSGGGATYRTIPVGAGLSRGAMYTTPAGFSLYVDTYLASAISPSSSQNAAIGLYVGSPVTGTYQSPTAEFNCDGSGLSHKLENAMLLPEKTDFQLRCTATNGNGVNVAASFSGLLFDNTLLGIV